MDQRPKTINIWQENIGQKHHGIRFGNDFLVITCKVKVATEKINWNSWRVDNFVCQKTWHCQQNKNQPLKWEEILANHIFDKGLVCRIYIEFLKLNHIWQTKSWLEVEQKIWVGTSPKKICK